MKKTISLFVAILAFSFAAAAQGVITFKKVTHDFGKVKEGEKAVYTYEFTNTGDAPIVISNAQPSCGCTTPSWTKTAVLPGKTGSVTASFDSSGKPGAFNKNVTVTSNATVGSISLSFKGEVLPKAAAPKAQ
ncbi:MAG: DUF1573 domain-containing protein [Bacteroidota bacterium]